MRGGRAKENVLMLEDKINKRREELKTSRAEFVSVNQIIFFITFQNELATWRSKRTPQL
jgi:hypothetical protein